MYTLRYRQCFLELFRSNRFIDAGIPGMDRIFGEISCTLDIIRNFHIALFKDFEQPANDMGMRALPILKPPAML